MNDVFWKLELEHFKPHEQVFVRDMDYVSLSTGIRIYYNLDTESGSGFTFTVVKVDGYLTGFNDESCWGDENALLEVNVLMEGVAFFDGIRHITSGEGDNFGYLYYPDSKEWIEIWQTLNRLEKTHCKTPHWEIN